MSLFSPMYAGDVIDTSTTNDQARLEHQMSPGSMQERPSSNEGRSAIQARRIENAQRFAVRRQVQNSDELSAIPSRRRSFEKGVGESVAPHVRIPAQSELLTKMQIAPRASESSETPSIELFVAVGYDESSLLGFAEMPCFPLTEPLVTVEDEPCLLESRKTPSTPSTADSSCGHHSPKSLLLDSPEFPETQLSSAGDRKEDCISAKSDQMHCHTKICCNLRKKLDIATDLIHHQGWWSVKWEKDFSALHLAAKHCSKAHVRLLTRSIHDSSGLHALECALDTKDSHGKTPFEYASESMLTDRRMDLELLDLLCPVFAQRALEVGELHHGRNADTYIHGSRDSVPVAAACSEC